MADGVRLIEFTDLFATNFQSKSIQPTTVRFMPSIETLLRAEKKNEKCLRITSFKLQTVDFDRKKPF